MKFIYPAVFKKTEDGRYKGTFPDLEGCFGEGDTLDEAIESANAAAFDWISVELSEEVPELPPITDPDDMELEDEDVVRNIQVNIRLYDGWPCKVFSLLSANTPLSSLPVVYYYTRILAIFSVAFR